ncbi:MAG: 3-hydroxyacyl-CoA dehydrogenase family protein [Treponema sp.]|nr:3-hydroxyacyl-CoA dehydrogenase family protein [Treponema sp.]
MKNVTCFGTGLIGTGWSVVFLRGGCKVKLYDIDQGKIDDAKKNLDTILDFLASKGLMNEDQRKQYLANVSFTMDVPEAVKDADFIQENGPDNLELKQKIIKSIEDNCRPDTIIASSTSGLLIADIAAGAKNPERILGGHPYNPPYMMPLVEISKTDKTSQKCVEAARAFYIELGKEPVILNKEVKGFLCNRIQGVVCREAMDLVNKGVCTVEDIDKAIVFGLGLRWGVIGPHLVNTLGGGAGGFKQFWHHLSTTFTNILKDIDNWSDIPPAGYVEKAEPQIAQEMANRAKGTGQTVDELRAYLNNGMVELLKFHKKF